MCEKKDISEAYKSVIDFNKVIISISSTILTGLIAFLIFRDIDFVWSNYLSPIFFVVSIFCSIYSFGNAIGSIKKGESNSRTILIGNIGAYSLLAGIISLLFINTDRNSIDSILDKIENSGSKMQILLSPKNIQNIELKHEEYIFNYQLDSLKTEVIYSLEKDRITSIKKE